MANRIIEIANARIMFRNFRGEKRRYNNEGDRNFNVVLTEEQAETFKEWGLNVKTYAPDEGDTDPVYLLKVTISYKYKDRSPSVVMIKHNSKTYLTEATVGNLDFAQLESLDLILNASFYMHDDNTPGSSVYLQAMYAKVFEDEFALKYADLPTTNADDED